METQNLVISFDYSWFLAKNLAYAECLIMKFHYRNSSNVKVENLKNKFSFLPFFQKIEFFLTAIVCGNCFFRLRPSSYFSEGVSFTSKFPIWDMIFSSFNLLFLRHDFLCLPNAFFAILKRVFHIKIPNQVSKIIVL